MKFRLDQAEGRHVIRRHAPGEVIVDATRYTTSFILLPDRIIPDWPPSACAALRPAHFEMLVALQPELVILGTGDRLIFPDAAITQGLLTAGIGLEVMDTAAACRTYNVLAAEGRRVAAAFLL